MWSFTHARKAPSLEGPLRKIEWAKKHTDNLTAKVNSFLALCGYKVRKDFVGDPPSLVVTVEKVNFPPVPDDFSILAGEAIYHLRTALDHLIFELIRANKHEPSRENMWPVLSQQDVSLLKSRTQGVSETAIKLIESHQPYSLGSSYQDHPLWQLNKLNNWDKHNFLIRTFLARPRGLVFEWTDSNGRSTGVSQYTTREVKPGHKFSWGPAPDIRPGMDIKIYCKPRIVFEDVAVWPKYSGVPLQPAFHQLTASEYRDYFDGTDAVTPILVPLIEKVSGVVQSFQGEFP